MPWKVKTDKNWQVTVCFAYYQVPNVIHVSAAVGTVGGGADGEGEFGSSLSGNSNCICPSLLTFCGRAEGLTVWIALLSWGNTFFPLVLWWQHLRSVGQLIRCCGKSLWHSTQIVRSLSVWSLRDYPCLVPEHTIVTVGSALTSLLRVLFTEPMASVSVSSAQDRPLAGPRWPQLPCLLQVHTVSLAGYGRT